MPIMLSVVSIGCWYGSIIMSTRTFVSVHPYWNTLCLVAWVGADQFTGVRSSNLPKKLDTTTKERNSEPILHKDILGIGLLTA